MKKTSRRKLRIGQISPINLPVPPKKYGGTEKIVYWLCQEFHKRGHKVFLFGTGNSDVNCKIVPIVEKGLWETKQKKSNHYYNVEMAIVAQKARELKLDILHDHLGPSALPLTGLDIPMIHTLHVPFKGEDRVWAYNRLNSKLVSISNNQRKPAPKLNYVKTIYNGIDLDNFTFNPNPKDYFIWVGELSPRKGILEVIQIAKKAKLKLIIIGRIPPTRQGGDYRFFKKYVEKELNKENIKYLGEFTRKTIVKYYRNAKAFLYPLQWEEPFGLTMAESMACGTPVIAFRRGSVPEVINNGKTGFVIKPTDKDGKVNYKEFISAIKNLDKIKRQDCRKWVEDNFSIKKMIDDYEDLYYKLVKK